MGFSFSLGLGGISFSSSNSPSSPSNGCTGQGWQGGMQQAGSRHHHHHHHHHAPGMGQGQGGQNCMSNPLQQLLGPLTAGVQLGEDLAGGGPCGGGSPFGGGGNPLSLLGGCGGGGGAFALAGAYC